jgi:hypothetical protein
MVNERSLANLKPFTKNDPRRARGGRRKAYGLLDLLVKYLNDPCVPGSKVTKREMFVNVCIDKALSGDPFFAKLIWEYIEGKPDERIILGIYDAAREIARSRGLDEDKVISILDELKKRRTG